MQKFELRKKYKHLRASLTNAEINAKSLAIANQLLNLPIWDKTYYHIFLSIIEHKEINTQCILNILLEKNKHIVVSKSNFETLTLTHFLFTNATVIKKNSYNIPEPESGIEILSNQIEVVFIPLLAFDVKGNRVGYGKGFYDRFLSECKPETIKIGLSFFEAETKITDVFKSDVKLDYCVMPVGVYEF